MIFKPELCDLVLARRKTVTRRPVSNNPRSPWWRDREWPDLGVRTYALQPGRGKAAVGRIAILTAGVRPLGQIRDADAVLEGFKHRGEFVAYWERLYGSFDPEQLVWRIAFRLVGPDGKFLTPMRDVTGAPS